MEIVFDTPINLGINRLALDNIAYEYAVPTSCLQEHTLILGSGSTDYNQIGCPYPGFGWYDKTKKTISVNTGLYTADEENPREVHLVSLNTETLIRHLLCQYAKFIYVHAKTRPPITCTLVEPYRHSARHLSDTFEQIVWTFAVRSARRLREHVTVRPSVPNTMPQPHHDDVRARLRIQDRVLTGHNSTIRPITEKGDPVEYWHYQTWQGVAKAISARNLTDQTKEEIQTALDKLNDACTTTEHRARYSLWAQLTHAALAHCQSHRQGRC